MNGTDFIERELEQWAREDYISYAREVEAKMADAVHTDVYKSVTETSGKQKTTLYFQFGFYERQKASLDSSIFFFFLRERERERERERRPNGTADAFILFLAVEGGVVNLPPHLYGELAKTETGFNILMTNSAFLSIIDSAKSDSVFGLEKRAALWAAGHVGASELGLAFLLERHVLESMLDQTLAASSLSLRGTCLMVRVKQKGKTVTCDVY